MPRPNPNTVIAPKKIVDIVEAIFGSSGEITVNGDRTQKSMLGKFAKNNPNIIEIRTMKVMFARKKVFGKPKTKKGFKKTSFMFLSFDFSLIGFAWAISFQLLI